MKELKSEGTKKKRKLVIPIDSLSVSSDSEDFDYKESEVKSMAKNEEKPKIERKKKDTIKKTEEKVGDLKIKGRKRKRMLFVPDDPQLWSSDSEDYDYQESGARAVIKKDVKTKTEKKKKEIVKETEYDSRWGYMIPVNVLFNIFEFLISSEGAASSLLRATGVCRLWREVGLIPRLWKQVDLSFVFTKKKEVFHALFDCRMCQLVSLNITGWSVLKGDSWELVMDCPRLTSIDLSGTAISGQILLSMTKRCLSLECITLSQIETGSVSYPTLIEMTQILNARLKSFQLSDCKTNSTKFPSFFKAILKNCPSMEVFILRRVRCRVSFKVAEVQRSWSHLRILHLNLGTIYCFKEIDDNTRLLLYHERCINTICYRAVMACSSSIMNQDCPGFPELEELSFSYLDNLHDGSNFLYNLLHKSERLKVLDVRKLVNVSFDCLGSIGSDVVSQLYLCKPMSSEAVCGMLKRWSKTLIEVDISDMTFSSQELNDILDIFVNESQSVLEGLNLRATAVSPEAIVHLLNGCPNLKKLDLTSCRGLPRGIKKVHEVMMMSSLQGALVKYLSGV